MAGLGLTSRSTLASALDMGALHTQMLSDACTDIHHTFVINQLPCSQLTASAALAEGLQQLLQNPWNTCTGAIAFQILHTYGDTVDTYCANKTDNGHFGLATLLAFCDMISTEPTIYTPGDGDVLLANTTTCLNWLPLIVADNWTLTLN